MPGCTSIAVAVDPAITPFAIDQEQVPHIDDQTHALADNENDFFFMNRIGEQHNATTEAAEPKWQRDNAAANSFAHDPLDDKPRAK